MSFADLLTEDLRLVFLRALQQVPGYNVNESILHDIAAQFGHKVSRDKVKTELAWLQEQRLVTLEEAHGYYIATLTQRGADVACGCCTVPGVKRPSPKGC